MVLSDPGAFGEETQGGWAEPHRGCQDLLNLNPGSGTDLLRDHVSQFAHLQTLAHL